MNNETFQENIIFPALEVVKNSKIKKFFYLPGILGILILSTTLVYQVVYTYVVILGKKDKALEIVLNFFHTGYALETLVVAIIIFLIYMVLEPIYEGALVHMIDNFQKGKNLSSSESFGIGLTKFGPVFEYNNLFSMFKIVSILNSFLFMIRFLGVKYRETLSICFVIFFIFSVGFNTFFSYTKYIIILEGKGVFEAISASASMTLHNLKLTIKLYILMIFLNLRVILNFLFFFIIPIIFALILGYVSTKIYLTISLISFGIISVLIILILGYLSTVFEILTNAIWYNAYKQAKKVQDEHNSVD